MCGKVRGERTPHPFDAVEALFGPLQQLGELVVGFQDAVQ
jgi:hypothetical protein